MTVVRAPIIEGGVLVFFVMRGEMSPSANEVRVELASARVSFASAMDLYVRTATPTAKRCEPFAACGCPNGCVHVGVLTAGGRERLRVLDGPRAGELVFRATAGHPVRTEADESCTESCPPAPAAWRCESAGDGCAEIAAP